MQPWSALVPEGDTLPGLWREGGNPAGLPGAGLSGTGWFQVSAGARGGTFHRVRDPSSALGLDFSMGGSRLPAPQRSRAFPSPETTSGGAAQAPRPWSDGEASSPSGTGGWQSAGWTAEGAFRYSRRGDRGVRWAAVSDPYEGTPYIWSDSTGGDWGRDDVSVAGRLATGHGRLGAGFSLEADYGQGARRNDPRPLFRVRTLRFAPGISWSGGGGEPGDAAVRRGARVRAGAPGHPGAGWQLGMHLELASTQEESEIGYFAGDDPFVFRFRGHGTFDRTQLVRATRTREGRHLGVGVQFVREGSRGILSTALTLGVREDSIRQGIARPEPGGGYRARVAGVHSVLTRGALETTLSGQLRAGEGRDPVFQAINVEDLDASADLRVVRSGTRGEAGLGLGAEILRREDLAADTRWSVTMVGLEGTLERALGAPAGSGARGGKRPAAPSGGAGAVRPAAVQLRGSVHLPASTSWETLRPTPVTPQVVLPEYFHAGAPRGSMGLAVGGWLGILHLRTQLDVVVARPHALPEELAAAAVQDPATLRSLGSEVTRHAPPRTLVRTQGGVTLTLLQR